MHEVDKTTADVISALLAENDKLRAEIAASQTAQSTVKNTSDARSVILEIIGWVHMIEWTGGYPDWLDRAKQAVGMFDGGAE